jgi:hypothetical protein
MNRIAQISILVVMLLFVACDLFKSINKRFTDYHYMINPSGKRIVHELTFGVPREYRDSTLRYYSDGSNDQEKLELEWVVSYVVGLTKEHTQAVIGYWSPFYLYNISDTTSLYWDNWEPYDSLKFCPFYWGNDGNLACDDRECNRISNHYVMISDSLLSLMQKDYSMLEKFSEYYEQK